MNANGVRRRIEIFPVVTPGILLFAKKIQQMCQKFEDFRGIELQNDKLAGFRGILSETLPIRKKIEDCRRIVLQNEKLGGFSLNFVGYTANVQTI